MTSLQLAQRLMRNLKIEDLAQAPADDVLTLLDAINAGIQEFYNLAPTCLKRRTVSGTLFGPKNITIGVTNLSKAITGYTPLATELNCTVKINGESLDHEFASTTELVDEYLGTTGSQTATIYGDTLNVSGSIERILTAPVVDGVVSLRRVQDFDRIAPGGGGLLTSSYNGGLSGGVMDSEMNGRGGTRNAGRPNEYSLESRSIAGAQPYFLFRVNPLPDRNYRVRFDAEITPPQIGFVDMHSPVTLAIQDSHIEQIIIPLCNRVLVQSSLWKDPAKSPLISEAATRAESMISLLSVNFGLSANRCMTPAGY